MEKCIPTIYNRNIYKYFQYHVICKCESDVSGISILTSNNHVICYS